MKRSTVFFGLFLFVCSVVLAQTQQLKIIAVASLHKTENGQIGQRAARAPYYLIFDNSGKLLEFIANPFYDAARGAGPKVANLLARKNVTIVVAGAFGNKMITALDEEGIDHHEATGMVKKAVEELIRSNRLKR